MSTEDLFWKDMDNSFIDIIKAVTALSTKSYISISNLKTDITRNKDALDDFGTGNSSLSLALELPFDELKVDMSFIKDIKNKPQNQAMVQSIVDYAKRTNKESVYSTDILLFVTFVSIILQFT